MKRKGKTICSLLGHKIAHCPTVDEDLDWGMIEGAFEDQGFLGKGFAEAAEFEGICGSGGNLILGPGIQREVWCNRALFSRSPGGLQFPGDYSFPDSSVSGVSIAFILGERRLVRVQSRARCPAWRQRKQPPLLRSRSRSLGVSLVIASTSMGTVPPGA